MNQASDTGGLGYKRPLILIAEDVGIQAKLAQICLERAGYRVASARDGKEALDSIRLERPDLVLLDVDMPVMNGFQLLDRLRQEEGTRDIPVIMLTAHAKDSGLFGEWATTRDEFMTKPFSPNELLNRVNQVLSAS